jgi:hypothetical protein
MEGRLLEVSPAELTVSSSPRPVQLPNQRAKDNSSTTVFYIDKIRVCGG